VVLELHSKNKNLLKHPVSWRKELSKQILDNQNHNKGTHGLLVRKKKPTSRPWLES
jgi:hypothetical protein